MSQAPVRVAALGMGWWSDVLADAMQRSGQFEIVACYTRSADKRRAFAEKYGCRPAASYEEILKDPSIAAVINTTPNNVHLETTRQAAEAGKHVFLDKPIANTVQRRACDRGGVQEGWRRAGARIPATARKTLSLDQIGNRRRPFRQAGASRMQHQPRQARPVRHDVMALHGGRNARRRHVADWNPLYRRARIPDGARSRAFLPVWLSSCFPATTRMSPT